MSRGKFCLRGKQRRRQTFFLATKTKREIEEGKERARIRKERSIYGVYVHLTSVVAGGILCLGMRLSQY